MLLDRAVFAVLDIGFSSAVLYCERRRIQPWFPPWTLPSPIISPYFLTFYSSIYHIPPPVPVWRCLVAIFQFNSGESRSRLLLRPASRLSINLCSNMSTSSRCLHSPWSRTSSFQILGTIDLKHSRLVKESIWNR
jgi:hypothetical protein